MSGFAKFATIRSYGVARDGLDQGVGDPGRAHLRLEVVRRDLRARDQAAILAGQRRLASAVEEVRDVGVLLGLGDVELPPAGVRRGMGERVRLLGREGDLDRAGPASYSVIVTTSRSRGRGPAAERSNPAKSSPSASAWVSWRARSARKFAWTIASPSRTRPSTPSMTVGLTNSSFSPRA